jgi:ribonuclease VapC
VIVDASVLVGILLRQDGYRDPWERLVDVGVAYAGAPTLLEAAIVLRARLGEMARPLLETLLHDLEIQTVPFDERHWRVGLDAFTRFGKGRHPAALNFGDCLTYATAVVERRPLLCLGDDFALTDVELA